MHEPTRAFTLDEVRGEVDALRARVLRVRDTLSGCFVGKDALIELMLVCTLAQEPLLLVGRPGTAKSDLVVRFCQAIGVTGEDYFEYMLTRFTEPGEIIGPIDIARLKEGRYLRRVEGKLPTARVVFLDEIFKSNSAILNTLLTIINERKYYQDGQPVPVRMRMLFGATNEIPELVELAALRDRFVLKVESRSVREHAFDALIEKGLEGDALRASNQRPWADTAALEDFEKLKLLLDHLLRLSARDAQDRQRWFPKAQYATFRRILTTLEKEEGVEITDRRVVKLYKLVRARAFLLHGGVVRREDLIILRYVADRIEDFEPVAAKVDQLLRLS